MKYVEVATEGRIKVNQGYIAESLEQKLERVLASNEPIDSTAPIIYTERKDGVIADYDIRTDRMEMAQEAMTIAAKSFIAQREERIKQAEATSTDATYVTE